MLKDIWIVFLTGHMLGDFYLQTSVMAEEKEENYGRLLTHGLIYLTCMIILGVAVFGISGLKWGLLISVLHLMIDFLKCRIKKKGKYRERNVIIYVADQLLHIAVIILAGAAMRYSVGQPHYTYLIELTEKSFYIDFTAVFSWILALLFSVKPCSITTKIVLAGYRPQVKSGEIKNGGAMIGIFERYIIFLLLFIGQYGAIGLVLTAKSIARYNKMTEDPQFAEYYLLGTLLSMALVMTIYLFLFYR